MVLIWYLNSFNKVNKCLCKKDIIVYLYRKMEFKCLFKVNLNNIYYFLIRREWIKEVEWWFFVEYFDFILELCVVFV